MMRRILNSKFFILNCLMLASVAVAAAQIPFQPGWKYRSGQNVVPAFEGWLRNPDGSFDMLFGYLNRNYEESLDVSVGANNSLEPGGPDQGQPTFFLPGRHRFFFAVRVPKDWPTTRKLTWTLVIRGRTEKANGFLLPEWEVDTSTIQGSLTAGMDPLNKPPTIAAAPAEATISLPDAATLTARAADDGRPVRRPGPPGGGRGSAQTSVATATAAAAEPGRGAASPAMVPIGLRVEWVQYRGPSGGRITFSPPATPVADGTASTTATFSVPGRYVVRAFANDGAVTTPADIAVTVNAKSAGR
jgi:hypothetical protein